MDDNEDFYINHNYESVEINSTKWPKNVDHSTSRCETARVEKGGNSKGWSAYKRSYWISKYNDDR